MHWYISKETPPCDMVYIDKSNIYYGYKKEPTYEEIERYDLRVANLKKMNETFDWRVGYIG